MTNVINFFTTDLGTAGNPATLGAGQYGLLEPGTFIATPSAGAPPILQMDISPGKFIYTTYVGGFPVNNTIDFPGATNVPVDEVGTRVVSMYGMDVNTGLIVQRPDFFTPQEIESGFIPGGVLIHFDKGVTNGFTGSIGSQTLFFNNNLESYFLNRHTAPVSLKGNVYGFNTDLTLNVSGGPMYYQGSNHHITPGNPHTKVLADQAVVSNMLSLYVDVTGDAVLTSIAALDVSNYNDLGTGTLVALGNAKFGLYIILNSPITGTTYIVYGTEEYANLTDGIAAAEAIFDLSQYPVWVPNGTAIRGVMVIQEGTTNLLSGLGTSTYIGLAHGFEA